jgi:hypothetical protein
MSIMGENNQQLNKKESCKVIRNQAENASIQHARETLLLKRDIGGFDDVEHIHVYYYYYYYYYYHYYYYLNAIGSGSSVGIATGYRLDGPGIESPWGRDFSRTSVPALGPTQSPVQFALGLSRG